MSLLIAGCVVVAFGVLGLWVFGWLPRAPNWCPTCRRTVYQAPLGFPKFCSRCGAGLVRHTPRCPNGHKVDPFFDKYCPRCGVAVGG